MRIKVWSFTAACLLVAALGASPCLGQSSPKRASGAAHKTTAALRTECTTTVGLCTQVPSGWQRLGDIYDGLGFVVAEPHAGSDQASWPQLTVAAMDAPPSKPGAPARTLGSLIDIVLTPDGTFTSSETLERSHLLLNGADAEMVRVRLHDSGSNSQTIEELALIQGEDEMVYSIALRCAPDELPRMEPLFQRAVHSWHVKEPAADKTKQEPVKK